MTKPAGARQRKPDASLGEHARKLPGGDEDQRSPGDPTDQRHQPQGQAAVIRDGKRNRPVDAGEVTQTTPQQQEPRHTHQQAGEHERGSKGLEEVRHAVSP